MWLWGILCAFALGLLVVLFFPFVFWIGFSADFEGVAVHVRLFKKELYAYTKTFKREKSPEGDAPGETVSEETSAKKVAAESPAPQAPVEKTEAPKPEQKSEPEQKKEAAVKPEPEKKSEPKQKEEPPPKEKPEGKRSLTDEEFWTLLLTPEFDRRAWWSVRHWLSALFKLFRIRFVDCVVEGIRMEYRNMGYAASLNAFLKAYPYIGDWDFRMDWTYSHEPRCGGHIRASVNLCRMLGLLVATLFYGGIVAFTFWRRRARILRTNKLPELGFIRKKLVKTISED